MMPPMRAWLELEGSVKYQVMRFHRIAPMRAANTRDRPVFPESTVGSTIPLAIAAATLIEMNAPTRLRTADISTATRGFSAPGNRRQPITRPPGDYSVELNSQMATPSMTRPRATIIAASTSAGTCQPHHVMPGSSARRAAGEMLRWLKTMRRIGSTA